MLGPHPVIAVILVLTTLAEHLDKNQRTCARLTCDKAAAIVRRAVAELQEI